MSNFLFLRKLFNYKLFAKHKGGHGIHSPFVFDLITSLIEHDGEFYNYRIIENLRAYLLADKRIIEVCDCGAGSKVFKTKFRKISQIARHSAISHKHGKLLFRLVNRFKANTILELGTSLGISTLYLAFANRNAKVITIEACKETSNIAREIFKKAELKNIVQINGLFENTLLKTLQDEQSIDFVFFDGNHTFEATMSYFETCLPFVHNQTVFVFDDIHWSIQMENAWKQIIKHPKITASIDLFFMGIAFFRKEMQQQNFVIKF